MNLGVDVDSSLHVETREDGLHLHHTIRISWPHSSKEGRVSGVEIIPNRLVQLSEKLLEWSIWRQSLERRVATCGVAMPQIHEHAFNWLTGVCVQDTDVEVQRDTGLVLGHVLSEGLRTWPDVRSSGDFRCENASVVLDDIVVWSLSSDDHRSVESGSERAALIVSNPALRIHGCCLRLAALGEPGAASELVEVESLMVARMGCDGHSSYQSRENREILHVGDGCGR